MSVESGSTSPTSADLRAALALEGLEPGEAERLLRQAVRKRPRHEETLLTYAGFLRRRGRGEEGLAVLRSAAGLRTASEGASLALARALHESGRSGEAMAALEARAARGSAAAAIALGRLALSLGDHPRALRALREAAEREAGNAEVQRALGDVLADFGQSAEAIAAYEAARRCGAGGAALLTNLATAYRMVGRLAEARGLYEEALRIDGAREEASAGLAEIALLERDEAGAEAAVSGRIAGGSMHPGVVSAWARILAKRGQREEATEALLRCAEGERLAPQQRANLLHQAGAMEEQRGRYAEAFTLHTRANRQKAHTFSAEAYRAYIESLMEAFSASALSRLPRAGNESERPVFVISLPRAGSSLVEQILAAHPEVYGGGELEAMRLVISDLPRRLGTREAYPTCISQLTQEVVDGVAVEYLANLEAMGGGAARVTDKLPHNFLHLGLISRLFPRARVIHCRRHPLDTLLSCYCTQLSAAHNWSTSLEDLAVAYREYDRLMRHWSETLDLPVLEVEYESLVADLEGWTRRMLEFLGLPFDEACLRYYESGRITLTASAEQATKPIYTSSVGRHRQYARELQPLAERLADLLPDDA